MTGSLLSFSSVALIVVLLICAAQAWFLFRLRGAMRRLAREVEVRKRREQEARAANLAKDQFLANASHEIRTPMNGVLGMADLLLRGEMTAAQRGQVKLIRTSAEALLALVGDILDLARIEAGHLLLRPRDFRLREVVDEVVRLLASQAAERGIELRFQVAADLPDELHGDSVRLRQVLINLVGNGIRHTTEGFVAVTVTAREGEDREGAPQIRFEVRDTGIGIRPEVQARLFRPFSRSESSASRVPGGAGLGLVISKNIVELMAGEIGLESTYGAGSTFWFQVPLVAAQGTLAEDADSAVSRGPAPDRPEDDHDRRDARRNVHVLVVDDHPVNRALALAQLQDLGYVADTAENGQEALDLLAGRSYDAVVLDCAMPEIDGYETCRRLRQREGDGRRTPVIALTAFANEGEREKCLAAGMDDYLAKPYRGEALAAMVDRWTAERAREAARIEERLSSLQRLGDAQGEELRARIAEVFREHGAHDLETMRIALARGDGEAVAAAGHSLGGSAGVLGATALATCCAELETLARQGDLAACAPRLQVVEREYRAFEERLAP